MAAYALEIMPFSLRAKSTVIQTIAVKGLIVLGRYVAILTKFQRRLTKLQLHQSHCVGQLRSHTSRVGIGTLLHRK